MSKEAPIEASVGAGVAFAESTIFEEEAPTTVDIPLKGFFDGADVIAEAMASATTATTKEVSVEVPIPPSRPILAKEGTPIEEDLIGEFSLVSAKLATP